MRKEHSDLIDIVEMIDPDAAHYLRNDARELGDFKEADTVILCFTWANTPQGHDYWARIHINVRKFKRTGKLPVKRSIVPKELFDF